jgi:tRNA G18 (ribose-2'-O)-methylase SpoU
MQDNRNVIDYYKYWKTDAIKADLDTKRNPFSVVCCNIHGDFNLGSIVRNANAFLAKEVIIYGNKKWDKRGAVGTHNYTQFKHVKESDELPNLPMICIDNVEGAKDIRDYMWLGGEFMMVFGEEQVGIPKQVLQNADEIVYIPQLGSVRSLNVGCASAIAMYDYIYKMNQLAKLDAILSNIRIWGNK